MARFKGDISGSRGNASRLGTTASGISAHVRGWNLGIRIYGDSDSDNREADGFTLYATGGSNNPSESKRIGYVRLEDGAPVLYVGDSRACIERKPEHAKPQAGAIH